VCGITGLIVTPVVREPRRQRPDGAVHALHLDRIEPRGHAHLTGPAPADPAGLPGPVER
jgi:hypothetical protein